MTPPRPAWMSRVQTVLDETPPAYFHQFRPPAEGGRASAVLMLFGPSEDGDVDVVLTERAHDMRSHPGQVSFPGGSLDESDAGPVAAALREAQEEVGLEPDSVDIVHELPELYLRPSRFVVTPVLAWWQRPHPIGVVDHREVHRVVRAPLAQLVDAQRRFTVSHPSGYTGPGFDVEGLFVWGFTALLLDRVLEMGGLSAPWDSSVSRELPGRFWPTEGARS